MSKFYSLFSSSKGNASFLGSLAGGVLVDAGVSCRRLLQALEARRIPAEAVRAVCVTHTHADHIAGLRVFLGKHPVPVYGTAEMLEELQKRIYLPASVPLRILAPGETTSVEEANLEVTAFSTLHDAPGSCGFRFGMPDGRSCAVCTDLGRVTPEVEQAVTGADLVLLEANYDPEMLRKGPYPAPLQRRIQGDYGHLSNSDSADLAQHLIAGGTTRLVLGHLSQQNNTMPLAQNTVLKHLKKQKMHRNRDFLLEVSTPEGLEQAVIF